MPSTATPGQPATSATSASTTPPASRFTPLRRALLPLILTVALLAAAGAVVVAGSSLWARKSAERRTEQLTAAATEVALLLSSLSSGSAEASLDRLAELSTGTLQEDLAAHREDVLEIVDDDEVSAGAEVIASGVEHSVPPRRLFGDSDDPVSALLLIATRSEVSNVQSDEPVDRMWRWRIEAVLIDGQALVSSAEVAV